MPVPLLSGLMSLVRRMSLPRPFTTTTPPPPPHNVNVGAVCAAWDGRSMGEPLHNIEVGGAGGGRGRTNLSNPQTIRRHELPSVPITKFRNVSPMSKQEFIFSVGKFALHYV